MQLAHDVRGFGSRCAGVSGRPRFFEHQPDGARPKRVQPVLLHHDRRARQEHRGASRKPLHRLESPFLDERYARACACQFEGHRSRENGRHNARRGWSAVREQRSLHNRHARTGHKAAARQRVRRLQGPADAQRLAHQRDGQSERDRSRKDGGRISRRKRLAVRQLLEHHNRCLGDRHYRASPLRVHRLPVDALLERHGPQRAGFARIHRF